MLNDDYIVELACVNKGFGKSTLFRNVSLGVKQGDFVVIWGKSGVGKTTLVKVLGFLEAPDVGVVKWFGKDVTKLSDSQRSVLRLRNIGFVFQFFNLLPTLSVEENIELPLALASVKSGVRKQRINELLSYFQLQHLAGRFPANLSGGEKQRVAIIRALSNNPKILGSDEPTSRIDDENTELLMNLFKKINKNHNVTIVMTTTDLYETYPVNKDLTLKDGCLQQTLFGRERLAEKTIKL